MQTMFAGGKLHRHILERKHVEEWVRSAGFAAFTIRPKCQNGYLHYFRITQSWWVRDGLTSLNITTRWNNGPVNSVTIRRVV